MEDFSKADIFKLSEVIVMKGLLQWCSQMVEKTAQEGTQPDDHDGLKTWLSFPLRCWQQPLFKYLGLLCPSGLF